MDDDLKIGPQWRVMLADARSLADAYGWNPISDEVTPLGGAVNGVARIPTNIGDFVVRVHRPWTGPARLTAVHAVQDRLRKLGIPIPPVVATSAGQTFVTIPGDPDATPGFEHDRLVEVMEAVIADSTEETRDRADLVLAMLAPLHNALAAIDPASVPQPSYAAHVDVREAIAWLDGTDTAFATCASHPDFPRASAVRTIARELIEGMRQDRLALEPHLPRQLVHGDLGFGNVLVRDGRVVAVLDFDFMAERPRIFDLAYSLCHALTRLRSRHRNGVLAEDELSWFAGHVAAYSRAAHRPLTGPELDALPLEMVMVGLYQVAEAGFVANDPPRAIAQTLSIEHHLPLIAWLADVPDQLTSACRVAIGLSGA
ncbi:MAG: phosphotransferase [Chloroflexota bacterium]|nr:phosphotransferase [Chloroflexota bacterium]